MSTGESSTERSFTAEEQQLAEQLLETFRRHVCDLTRLHDPRLTVADLRDLLLGAALLFGEDLDVGQDQLLWAARVTSTRPADDLVASLTLDSLLLARQVIPARIAGQQWEGRDASLASAAARLLRALLRLLVPSQISHIGDSSSEWHLWRRRRARMLLDVLPSKDLRLALGIVEVTAPPAQFEGFDPIARMQEWGRLLVAATPVTSWRFPVPANLVLSQVLMVNLSRSRPGDITETTTLGRLRQWLASTIERLRTNVLLSQWQDSWLQRVQEVGHAAPTLYFRVHPHSESGHDVDNVENLVALADLMLAEVHFPPYGPRSSQLHKLRYEIAEILEDPDDPELAQTEPVFDWCARALRSIIRHRHLRNELVSPLEHLAASLEDGGPISLLADTPEDEEPVPSRSPAFLANMIMANVLSASTSKLLLNRQLMSSDEARREQIEYELDQFNSTDMFLRDIGYPPDALIWRDEFLRGLFEREREGLTDLATEAIVSLNHRPSSIWFAALNEITNIASQRGDVFPLLHQLLAQEFVEHLPGTLLNDTWTRPRDVCIYEQAKRLARLPSSQNETLVCQRVCWEQALKARMTETAERIGIGSFSAVLQAVATPPLETVTQADCFKNFVERLIPTINRRQTLLTDVEEQRLLSSSSEGDEPLPGDWEQAPAIVVASIEPSWRLSLEHLSAELMQAMAIPDCVLAITPEAIGMSRDILARAEARPEPVEEPADDAVVLYRRTDDGLVAIQEAEDMEAAVAQYAAEHDDLQNLVLHDWTPHDPIPEATEDGRPVSYDGSDFSRARFDTIDVSGASFARTTWDGATLLTLEFSGADFSGASFREANLDHASFVNVNLTGACFDGAKLSHCGFATSSLRDVDFGTAELSDCDLGDCDLTGADLSRATISENLTIDFEARLPDGAVLREVFLDRLRIPRSVNENPPRRRLLPSRTNPLPGENSVEPSERLGDE